VAPAPVDPRRRSRLVLAGFMLLMGTLHIAMPGPFDRIVPRALRRPRTWTYASGAAELASGVLLAIPRTRRAGAYVTAATMVAVYPANIQMALDTGAPRRPVDWLPGVRLPFQFPLIAWALSHRK
jgi:uncharacterized membrane protein